jgi:hypothetical protein
LVGWRIQPELEPVAIPRAADEPVDHELRMPDGRNFHDTLQGAN